LSWLEDGDGVISQIERDDKSTVNVLWDFGVESSGISQDLLVIINVFKEIYLRFFGDKLIDITERIDLVTKTVVWWDLNDNWVSGFWLLDVTEWEMSLVSAQVVVLGEFIDTVDIENSSISYKWLVKSYLITGEVSVTNEFMSWLVDFKSFW
jgi:hypothetical protein